MSNGTASSMRCGDELVRTGYPPRAKRVSTGPATSEGRLGRLNHEAAHGIWHLARESPGARLCVGPALGPVGRRQRGDGELRMPLEQLQEALPDGPRRPENADPNLLH